MGLCADNAETDVGVKKESLVVQQVVTLAVADYICVQYGEEMVASIEDSHGWVI